MNSSLISNHVLRSDSGRPFVGKIIHETKTISKETIDVFEAIFSQNQQKRFPHLAKISKKIKQKIPTRIGTLK